MEQVSKFNQTKYPIQFEILESIKEKNPRHYKKLASSLKGLPDEFYERGESFFAQYKAWSATTGRNLEYGIDSYLKMVSDTMFEQIRFMQTGEYTCKNFEDALENVYNNPDVMEYYMHGLMLSQFLWKHHYAIFKYFTGNLATHATNVNSYLEIGGGHGLYLAEAIEIIGEGKHYDLVDISQSSIDIAKSFIVDKGVNFFLQDIYKYETENKYDFITMGEVLEHVEDPVSLLGQIHRLLADDGTAFITTPANAPAIDHIYLFNDAEHIIRIIDEAGFKVVNDIRLYTEDLPEEKAKELKIPLMYGAFITKK